MCGNLRIIFGVVIQKSHLQYTFLKCSQETLVVLENCGIKLIFPAGGGWLGVQRRQLRKDHAILQFMLISTRYSPAPALHLLVVRTRRLAGLIIKLYHWQNYACLLARSILLVRNLVVKLIHLQKNHKYIQFPPCRNKIINQSK